MVLRKARESRRLFCNQSINSCTTIKTSLILCVKIYEHLENIKNGNDIKQIGSWSSTAKTPGSVSGGTSGGSGHAIVNVFPPDLPSL